LIAFAAERRWLSLRRRQLMRLHYATPLMEAATPADDFAFARLPLSLAEIAAIDSLSRPLSFHFRHFRRFSRFHFAAERRRRHQIALSTYAITP